MNRRIICFLCSALIITGIIAACGKIDTDQDLAAQLDSADRKSTRLNSSHT